MILKFQRLFLLNSYFNPTDMLIECWGYPEALVGDQRDQQLVTQAFEALPPYPVSDDEAASSSQVPPGSDVLEILVGENSKE